MSGSSRAPAAGDRPLAAELTVVIPTLGREILRRCLEALGCGSMLPARVVVVHQGEDDRVREWTASASLDATYVRSERRGRAIGVNRGVDEVTTRHVAITDDDCLVHERWVERMAARLAAEPDRLVTGPAEAAGDELPVALMTSRTFSIQERPRLAFDLLLGGNMGGALEVLRLIGPMDEDPCLATAEDGEYAYRALRAGVPIVYDPEIVVFHVGWRDAERRDDQYARYAISQAGFYGKYLRRGDLFMVVRTLIHLLRSLRRWASGVLRSDRDRAANGRAYVVGLLPGLVAGWRSDR